MKEPAAGPPRVARIEVHPEEDIAKRASAPIDLALRSTETALRHLTRVAMEEIRRGADSSPHVQAAERDLRSALKQLALVKRSTT